MKIILLILLSFFNTILFSQTWIWAKSVTGSDYDRINFVCAGPDGNGSVYVTGTFYSPSVTFGAFTLINNGIDNVFVAKYDASGNVVWAKCAGGTQGDYSRSISVDASGNAFITGGYTSPSITFGTTTLTDPGGFLVKYDANGNVLWAKDLAVNNHAIANSVSTDPDGNVFLTGSFQGTVSMDGITLTDPDSLWGTVFISKYDTNGNVLWAKSAGGMYRENAFSISADFNGNAFITGLFSSPTLTFGTTTLTLAGAAGGSGYINYNVFVAKYDLNGNVLWAKSAAGGGGGGSAGDNTGFSVSADINGNAYVTGWFPGASITFDTTVLINNGAANVFLAKYDPYGNVLWAKCPQGKGYNAGFSVSADPDGNVFLTGRFSKEVITFDSIVLTAPSASCPNPWGCVPLFVVKYDPNGNVLCGTSLASGGDDINDASADRYGNVYVGGGFSSTPFIVGSDTLTPTGAEAIFITKYTCDDPGMPTPADSRSSATETATIFPNPSLGIFTMEIPDKNTNDETQICIYDVLGNCIKTLTAKNKRNEIDLTAQSKGIYFLQMHSGKENSVKKIVLQ